MHNIPVIFQNVTNYDFTLLYDEIFKQSEEKGKISVIFMANDKNNLLFIGCLKISVGCNFLTLSLNQ